MEAKEENTGGKDLTESEDLLRKRKTMREAPWPSEDRTVFG